MKFSADRRHALRRNTMAARSNSDQATAEEFSFSARATVVHIKSRRVVTVSDPLGDIVRVGGSVAGYRAVLWRQLTTVWKTTTGCRAARGSLEMGGYGAPVSVASAAITAATKRPAWWPSPDPRLLTGAPVLDNVYDTRGGLVDPKQDIEAYGLAMNISVDLSEALTLRSISAWRKDDSFTPIDFDALPAADVDVPGGYFNEQVSQEVQLLVNSGPFSGMIGGYYLDATADTLFDVRLFTTLAGLTAFTKAAVDTETYAVFGDFTYDFSEQLSLSVGGRYTWDERTANILRQNYWARFALLWRRGRAIWRTKHEFHRQAQLQEIHPARIVQL